MITCPPWKWETYAPNVKKEIILFNFGIRMCKNWHVNDKVTSKCLLFFYIIIIKLFVINCQKKLIYQYSTFVSFSWVVIARTWWFMVSTVCCIVILYHRTSCVELRTIAYVTKCIHLGKTVMYYIHTKQF